MGRAARAEAERRDWTTALTELVEQQLADPAARRTDRASVSPQTGADERRLA